MDWFDDLSTSLRGSGVGCLGATLFVIVCVAAIFGLVLMVWWPYMGGE